MPIKTDLPPTQEEWGDLPKDDLDAKSAYQDFFGKTNQEAQVIFANNAIEGADSLRWMPDVPFRYYMQGFIYFVMHGSFNNDYVADAASCFLGLVVEHLEGKPEKIMPIMDEVLPVVEYVAKNQEKFSADVGIYGNFNEKREKILELWKKNT
jgi:hypothetical protein